jgi:hypothetical protein
MGDFFTVQAIFLNRFNRGINHCIVKSDTHRKKNVSKPKSIVKNHSFYRFVIRGEPC